MDFNMLNCFYLSPVNLLFLVVLPSMNIYSAGRRHLEQPVDT